MEWTEEEHQNKGTPKKLGFFIPPENKQFFSTRKAKNQKESQESKTGESKAKPTQRSKLFIPKNHAQPGKLTQRTTRA